MQPIIQSLLDLDYYKITMAQVAYRRFRDVPVTYGFVNRTGSVRLPDFVNERELREELAQVRTLRFTPEELRWLKESPCVPEGMFADDFLAFLADLRLPDVALANDGSTFKIEVAGPWPEAIFWETLILSVVAELYGRALLSQRNVAVQDAWAEGERRLATKIDLIRREPRIRFSDFGTRRRFSGPWHRHVVETLARELPGQFIGTSNVLFAKELGLAPIGTFAHEMYMVFSGIYHASDDEIRASHNKVLQAWWEQYGEPMSIALADNYGSEFFFGDCAPEQARAWRGLRHDSGDPFAFAEKAIAFYRRLGIDPTTKQIVFSDGLEADTMLRLVQRFADRIRVVFGWGTNLTNDVGFEPLQLIVKVIRACGHGTVKLADNFDKALGTPRDIERFRRIFGYADVSRLGVKY